MACLSDEPLSALCQGRFEVLKPYLALIFQADVPLLEEEDLVSAVEPEHRMLMKIFLRRHRMGADTEPASVRVAHKRYDIEATGTWPPLEEVANLELCTLNLRKKISASSVTAVLPLSYPESYTPLFKGCGEQNKRLALFSLADNGIHDGHLRNIIDFLHTIFPLAKDDHICPLQILDLSWNRLHGLGFGMPKRDFDETLQVLLRYMPYDGFVDITFNPLATSDKMALYHHLYEHEPALAQKLIWIPDSHLALTAWYVFIPDGPNKQSMVQTTRDAHTRYYSLCKQVKES